MKNIFTNTSYFFREVAHIIRLNRMSNIFSFFGTGLILFVLGLVVLIWVISGQLVEMLQEEAEINAYYDQNSGDQMVERLVNDISGLDGVWFVRLVEHEEAYDRMENILGEEAHILELFEQNPFQAFLEIRIHLDNMDGILEQIKDMDGIEYVRDNREVLKRIQSIARAFEILGSIVIAAVSITTLVIISHMIRQGIYQNREHIYTLRLLGAPESFIGFPFFLVGFLLTLGGGILAVFLLTLLINRGYGGVGGAIPFIPLPTKNELITGPVTLVAGVSIVLGILGSVFGLSSTRKRNN